MHSIQTAANLGFFFYQLFFASHRYENDWKGPRVRTVPLIRAIPHLMQAIPRLPSFRSALAQWTTPWDIGGSTVRTRTVIKHTRDNLPKKKKGKELDKEI